jgi:G:T-mismatch repair DNA endonuclease (very short patch repair protein)
MDPLFKGAFFIFWKGGELMVIAQCANCGKEIKTYPSRVKRNKKRESNFYCSQQCKSEYWSKHRTGENNPKSKPKITVKCAWCDADILLPSWRVKKSNRHFCSVQCKGSWQSEHNKGPLSPYYKKESHIALNCGYCGKKFETSISQYKRYKNNYCSRKCADKAKIGVELPGNRAELHKCICPICGKEFYQSKNTKNPKKTCSQKCGYVLRGQTRDKKVTLICQYCGKEYTVHNCEKERSKYCSRSCLALAKMVDGHSNTLPERLTANKLKEMGVSFIQQYPIDRMKVDFYLPENNTVLEVYGDYWHGNPSIYPTRDLLNETQKQNINRDQKRRHYLKQKGYNFAYVWEKQIKENPDILLKLLCMN